MGNGESSDTSKYKNDIKACNSALDKNRKNLLACGFSEQKLSSLCQSNLETNFVGCKMTSVIDQESIIRGGKAATQINKFTCEGLLIEHGKKNKKQLLTCGFDNKDKFLNACMVKNNVLKYDIDTCNFIYQKPPLTPFETTKPAEIPYIEKPKPTAILTQPNPYIEKPIETPTMIIEPNPYIEKPIETPTMIIEPNPYIEKPYYVEPVNPYPGEPKPKPNSDSVNPYPGEPKPKPNSDSVNPYPGEPKPTVNPKILTYEPINDLLCGYIDYDSSFKRTNCTIRSEPTLLKANIQRPLSCFDNKAGIVNKAYLQQDMSLYPANSLNKTNLVWKQFSCEDQIKPKPVFSDNKATY